MAARRANVRRKQHEPPSGKRTLHVSVSTKLCLGVEDDGATAETQQAQPKAAPIFAKPATSRIRSAAHPGFLTSSSASVTKKEAISSIERAAYGYSDSRDIQSLSEDEQSEHPSPFPDETVVETARKQRESMRNGSILGSEYRSATEAHDRYGFSEDEEEDGQTGHASQSRLVRDDDFDSYDQDAFEHSYSKDHISIAALSLSGFSDAIVTPISKTPMPTAKELEELMPLSEEDEDVREWENAQLLKGAAPEFLSSRKLQEEEQARRTVRREVKMPPMMDVDKPLSERVEEMREARTLLASRLAEDERNQASLETRKRESQTLLVDLKEAAGFEEEKLGFYEDFQSFFAAFTDLVGQKIRVVEELEERLKKAYTEQRIARLKTYKDRKFDPGRSIAELVNTVEASADDKDDAAIGKVREAAEELMNDVDPEYSDARKIALQFATWKERYPRDYELCYVDLNLPDIFELYCRVAMLRCEGPVESELILSMVFGDAIMSEEVGRQLVDRIISPNIVAVFSATFDPFSQQSIVQASRLSSVDPSVVSSIVRERFTAAQEALVEWRAWADSMETAQCVTVHTLLLISNSRKLSFDGLVDVDGLCRRVLEPLVSRFGFRINDFL